MVGSILLALFAGAIIGVVARLVMPGRQDIGMVMTVLLGALGGLIGSVVASQFGYHNANGGIAWIPFFIGVAAAVVLIAIYESVTGRRAGMMMGRRTGTPMMGRRIGTGVMGPRTRTGMMGRRTRYRWPW
ncbi:GlsB/YeaQ/YmgE family stress response membrane protein [Mycobacterium sp. E2733]|uniref:GlsB/YeaQ/YmgE family stress response membrane protein n=1 Tax=Mycobacterium sp. E2733 TaxID=1834138 RepID=UPI000A7975EA